MRNPIVAADLAVILSASLDWQSFAGKTVLISGANGFLPAYIVESLLFLNETAQYEPVKVIALVRNKERAWDRFAFYKGRSDFCLIVQDVCFPFDVDGPVDFIIHAASQASPKYYGKDPVGTLSANVIGTKNLLELAREKKSQGFLFFSSGEVYGEVDEHAIPIREDVYGYIDPTNVRACYAESKRMGENMCVSWHHQYGVPAKIVRPFHTYGPGMSLDDGRVFADFVADVVSQRDITLKSNGFAMRPFCYIADATIGFFTVLLNGANANAYNLANPDAEISIKDLAALIAGLFPERGVGIRFEIPANDGSYLKSSIVRSLPSIDKINALNWFPDTDLTTGFRRTILSFL
jgi:UDP-glucuronate decarboxylase